MDGEAEPIPIADEPGVGDALDRLADAVGRMEELQGQLGQLAASIRSLACQRRAVLLDKPCSAVVSSIPVDKAP